LEGSTCFQAVQVTLHFHSRKAFHYRCGRLKAQAKDNTIFKSDIIKHTATGAGISSDQSLYLISYRALIVHNFRWS
jgi:hypothetical protein